MTHPESVGLRNPVVGIAIPKFGIAGLCACQVADRIRKSAIPSPDYGAL